MSSRFRWVFCQLETLRHCLPPSVRRTLNELPESLDATYERVLEEIKKPNREHARRLLQCLVVAIRPLRVSELAEVLAVDFDDDEGIPKLNSNWRWAHEEQALLASCSSLIAIVEFYVESDVESDVDYDLESGVEMHEAQKLSRIVQFSHFSVKEFLMSARLAASSGDISRYHIDLQPAHMILAHACMSVLLRSDDRVAERDSGNGSPLARYAARHWVVHARDEMVSSCVQKAMEYLFDVDKPYFAAWRELYDIDTNAPNESTFSWFTERTKPGSPLYYAARCGFRDLVEHLVANDPKQVNATGGYFVTPLVAALAGEHFQTAKFLHDNGADPNVRGYGGITPLQSAAYHGEFEMVQLLLKYKADVHHARRHEDETMLHFALQNYDDSGRRPNLAVSLSNVARLLLEHGADVNARTNDGSTPLHVAAGSGSVEAIHVLLEHGADANARKNDDTTPLHEAARNGRAEAIRVLLEHGADANARKNDDTTTLHEAALSGSVEATRVLLEHGVDANARKKDDTTPLHQAAQYGRVKAIRVLLEHGADANARKDDDTTTLHEAARNGSVEAIRVLLEHGVDANARKNDDTTPLHEAARSGSVEAIRVLLEYGVDANARKNDDTTPLHDAAGIGSVEAIRVLLEHGADANARKNDDTTQLHLAAAHYKGVKAICMLLEHGADANARKNDDTTPLHLAAAQSWSVEAVRVLLEHGADANARKNDDTTPLHLAAAHYKGVKAICVLLEHGADANARKNDDTTPLHLAAQYGSVEGTRALLEHGANVGAEDGDGKTPFQVASNSEIMKLLSKHGGR